jgi:glucose-6-phosphate-specific signal transduction histidine kinase
MMRFLRLKLLLVIIFMASYHFGWKPGMQWTVIVALAIGLIEYLVFR